MVDLTTATRDEVIERFERDYLNRCPSALTGPGTQPRLLATLVADQVQPLYANCIKAARANDIDQMTLAELQAEASRLGVVLAGASASIGYVTITAATAGTMIFAGDKLTHPTSKAEFECLTTAVYLDGDEVPIRSTATGPEQNLAAGTVLQWSSSRAGCAATCVVFADSDGNGLKGGANEEGREQIIEKIRDQRANPPGSGNDSDLRRWARATPGIQIEEVFEYPAVYGPGTVGWCFTVNPDSTGSRIPNALQVALVRANIYGQAPRTDMGFHLALIALATAVVAQVTWSQDADQWADETPWPEYFEITPGAGSGSVQVSGASSPLVFNLATSNGDYTTCGDPVPGQTLGVWDAPNQIFRHKKIAVVTGAGPWLITCDGTLGASDNTYTPTVGQRAMPWSASLDLLIPPLVEFFATMGPGEAKATTYLDGKKARRDPESPKRWPWQVTKALEANMEALDCVASLDLTEGGTAYAAAHLPPYLCTLSQFSVFPA